MTDAPDPSDPQPSPEADEPQAGEAPAQTPAEAPPATPEATLSAEEVAEGNLPWTVELYADRARFLGPERVEHTLSREGIREQVDLITGLTLRRILMAPLRGVSDRKDALRFDAAAWETLCDWIRWPQKTDLVQLLRRRTSTAVLVGVVFIVSAFVNEAAMTSALQKPYIALGAWLIGVWGLSKAVPHRIVFLLDSGAYAVIAAGLGTALRARFAWMDAILFMLVMGLVASGINNYKTYRTLRDDEPAPAL